MLRRAFLALLIAPASAFAHSYRHSSLAIGHAWALPSDLLEGQVFFPLVNMGTVPDKLVGARSAVASLIELRNNNRYDDPPANSFELAIKKPFPMRPTARHLRLIGLSKPLNEGLVFSVILDFEQAGEIEIEVYVEATARD